MITDLQNITMQNTSETKLCSSKMVIHNGFIVWTPTAGIEIRYSQVRICERDYLKRVTWMKELYFQQILLNYYVLHYYKFLTLF